MVPADVDISARTGTIKYRTGGNDVVGEYGMKKLVTEASRVTIRTRNDLEELAVRDLIGAQAATTTSGTKLEAANDNYGEVRVTIRTRSDLGELAVRDLIGAQAKTKNGGYETPPSNVIDIKEYGMKKILSQAANGNYGKTIILSEIDIKELAVKETIGAQCSPTTGTTIKAANGNYVPDRKAA